jgi:hypothetical protein
MSGFEHQVAAHMMAEGMVEESLVITRMIHDRYHAAKRNPFNEIECSDHYARAMASFGTFITACGFEYHGPKGCMRFSPKINPEKFKSPFTAASSWGTYKQEKNAAQLKASLEVKYGNLTLKSFSVDISHKATRLSVMLNGKKITASFQQERENCTISFPNAVVIPENQILTILT